MPKPFIVHDPYRNIETTLKAFADAEGVPKHAVSHYFWYHKGSLEGFRDRPKKGQGNGIKPHTFTWQGKFMTENEAAKLANLHPSTIRLYYKRLGLTEVEKIVEAVKSETLKRYEKQKTFEVSGGRKMTLNDYAKEQGVSYNTVFCYLRHHGTLEGFESRGHSRVNPTMYHHAKLGMSKSLREWADFFQSNYESLKCWVYNHGNSINGYERRGRQMLRFEHKGESLTIREWAERFNISPQSLRNYIGRNNGLGGIEKYLERRNARRARKSA